MRASMILATASVLLCAVFSPVELFKFGKSHTAAPPAAIKAATPEATAQLSEPLDASRLYQPMYLAPPAPQYYPADFASQPLLAEAPAPLRALEVHASKSFGKSFGLMPPPPPPPPAPAHSLAYLVVRPVASAPAVRAAEPVRYQESKGGRVIEQPQQQQQEVEPQAQFEQQHQQQTLEEQAFYAQQQFQQQPLVAANLRPALLAAPEAGATKGGRQSQEQAEQTIQAIEQQHEQPVVEQRPQPALVVPVPPGKEGKFRAMLDKLMSKLTLGSSYQVVSEEIVVPGPQAQLHAQRLPQQPLQQQPIEQQQHVEEQRLEQQLEQQRDTGFDESTKQLKSTQQQRQPQQAPIQQLQHQEQLRDEQQLLAEQELSRQRQQYQQPAIKGQPEPPRQQTQELEVAPSKGKQQPLAQEPIRQELKGSF